MPLFGNGPKQRKLIYIFCAIVFGLIVLATGKCRAAELDIGGGKTMLRGPAQYAEATVIWPRQIGNIDLYAGAILIGGYEYAGRHGDNQIVIRAGIAPHAGRFGAKLGIAHIQNQDPLNSGNINFNLALTFDVTKHLTIQVGHVSNAGTHMPNIGRDLIGFTWRFR